MRTSIDLRPVLKCKVSAIYEKVTFNTQWQIINYKISVNDWSANRYSEKIISYVSYILCIYIFSEFRIRNIFLNSHFSTLYLIVIDKKKDHKILKKQQE